MAVDFEHWRRTASAGIALSVLPATALEVLAEVDQLRAIADCPRCFGDGVQYWSHGQEVECELCLPHRQARAEAQRKAEGTP